MTTGTIVVLVVVAVLVVLFVARSIRVVPQHAVEIVERLGRYSRTLQPGLSFVVPGMDRSRARVDLREQRLEFPGLTAISADNQELTVPVTILYQVTDPLRATYEIANHVAGLEQLTMTVLRNVIGELPAEDVLVSHGHIASSVQGVLTEAGGGWGLEVSRVELGALRGP